MAEEHDDRRVTSTRIWCANSRGVSWSWTSASSLESRFDLAYGAAHALCLAACDITGSGPSKRYIVFQVLPDTLGLGPELWRVLSKCHDMRNRTEYEGALDLDDRLVSDLIGACRKVAQKIKGASMPRRLGRNRDVTLSIPRDLPRFTAIDGVDAIADKWLASQR